MRKISLAFIYLCFAQVILGLFALIFYIPFLPDVLASMLMILQMILHVPVSILIICLSIFLFAKHQLNKRTDQVAVIILIIIEIVTLVTQVELTQLLTTLPLWIIIAQPAMFDLDNIKRPAKKHGRHAKQ